MKTKIIFLAIVLSSFFQVCFSQGTIKGKVTEEDGKTPVPYVSVYIEKNGKLFGGAVTEIDGRYTIKAIPPGKYTLKASLIGYTSSKINNVVVKSNRITFINIKLSASAIELEEGLIRWERPLISKDAGASANIASTMAGVQNDNSIEYDTYDNVSLNEDNINSEIIKSGQLTASELNDFSKWELWKDIQGKDLKEFQTLWQISPLERYSVQVKSDKGKAIIDAVVLLKTTKGDVVWNSKTDNTGKAELWNNLFSNSKNNNLELLVKYNNNEYRYENPTLFNNGINAFVIPAECNNPNTIDIAFVVDATASMDDEIAFLKTDLIDIIENTKTNFADLQINLGSVFYRCFVNSYVTKTSSLSNKILNTTNFINLQYAGEGGDEVVEEALKSAIDSLNWSKSARARLLFFVLDQQPLTNTDVINKLHFYIKKAAEVGVKIIPIVASAETLENASSMEYLMRSMALATNGTYVFLTDHSNIGNTHAKPTTDQYDVELLNNLIKKIIYQNCYVHNCNEKIDLKDISDTTYITNSPIIAHEIIDTSRTKKPIIPNVNIKDFSKNNDTIKQLNNNEPLNNNKTENSIDSNIIIKKTVKFYPNPTNGKITIEIEGEINEIYLADISGKLISKFNTKNETKLEINLSKYSAGIYFIKFNDNFQWYSGKIILTN